MTNQINNATHSTLAAVTRGKLNTSRRVNPRRVVVTGGAGFIGSHLCDRLVQKGCHVVCIDNLRTGELTNVGPLLNHPNFRFIEHDITNPLPSLGSVDQIYNLACPASPRHYQRDPIGTMRTCVLGAYNTLELARRKKARILQASTSEVYGDPEVHPQPESYVGHVNTLGPRACYDEGKRAAEALFADYSRVHGTEIKIARIFNTYGPRMLQDDGRVVSNFIVQALRNEPITIYGDGSQTRSLCFIEDMLDGLEMLMASPVTMKGPCNLGNPNEMPVSAIARLIVELAGSRSKFGYRELPEDDPKRRKPTIDIATSMLGWVPRITLESGLRATIEFFSLIVPAREIRESRPQAVARISRVRGGMHRMM